MKAGIVWTSKLRRLVIDPHLEAAGILKPASVDSLQPDLVDPRISTTGIILHMTSGGSPSGATGYGQIGDPGCGWNNPGYDLNYGITLGLVHGKVAAGLMSTMDYHAVRTSEVRRLIHYPDLEATGVFGTTTICGLQTDGIKTVLSTSGKPIHVAVDDERCVGCRRCDAQECDRGGITIRVSHREIRALQGVTRLNGIIGRAD
jgi:hypothetical protein